MNFDCKNPEPISLLNWCERNESDCIPRNRAVKLKYPNGKTECFDVLNLDHFFIQRRALQRRTPTLKVFVHPIIISKELTNAEIQAFEETKRLLNPEILLRQQKTEKIFNVLLGSVYFLQLLNIIKATYDSYYGKQIVVPEVLPYSLGPYEYVGKPEQIIQLPNEYAENTLLFTFVQTLAFHILYGLSIYLAARGTITKSILALFLNFAIATAWASFQDYDPKEFQAFLFIMLFTETLLLTGFLSQNDLQGGQSDPFVQQLNSNIHAYLDKTLLLNF